MRIPSSTYRLQFNTEFTFVDALRVLDYLHELGISDIYSSPVLKAQKGSKHGYDVTDPTEINPEIGTRQEFERFATRIKTKQMGLIVDVVPNHMAASPENPWWMDVLKKGELSTFAEFFDIDWTSGKIVLPILGKTYGECLESGEISLIYDNGDWRLRYFDHELPIHADRAGEPQTVDELDRLIAAQHYRLAYWRKAADAINYRRFFDVNELVGIRAERDEVFRATHQTILGFIEDGLVDGLRIDHVDGLLDPDRYLERLPAVYVIVEKILGVDEVLPKEWKTHGTTGYDFIKLAQSALIDPAGLPELQRIYAAFTGRDASPLEASRTAKRKVMNEVFAGEVTALTERLVELADAHRHARDLARHELREALLTVTACLQVYRTYIRDFTISDSDRQQIEQALQAAGCQPLCNALEFLRQVLLVQPAYYLQHQRRDYLDFVRQWQQFTGPVMAKGLEDTAFYVHNALVSLNEVGSGPNSPETRLGVSEFHRANVVRHSRSPYTMNAGTTHDTKRSEDVRARIDVLSEFPSDWENCLKRWSRWNPSDAAPDPNEQVLIYQTLIGAWPISRDRLQGYIIKALREAKTHTSWLQSDSVYEQGVLTFIDHLLDPQRSQRFLKDFLHFQRKIAYFGALNALSQTLLKITAPGIPDIYQGRELWDFSLTDPDNRRIVDYENRARTFASLRQVAKPKELLSSWDDGRIKMFLTWKALTFRRDHIEVFLDGTYMPVDATGPHSENIISFARRLANQWVLVAVPRLTSQLTAAGTPPIGRIWGTTQLTLPQDAPTEWRSVFTGKTVGTTKASSLFADLPFALLTPIRAPQVDMA